MLLEDLKLRIKEAPISAVIGHYIRLNKKGTLYQGLCPFHKDSNPSLTVNDSKGLFMCFVCQVGGDAITFVEKNLKLEFKDAVKDIAHKMGMHYEEDKFEKKADPKKVMAKKILTKASKIYQKIGNEVAPKTYTEFLEKRELSNDVAQNFEIGFAPGNNVLTNYLKSLPEGDEKKFAFQIAQEISLIRPDKDRAHEFYDVFRDRIMFPIWDDRAQVVGFGGRATLQSQSAKYYNSQESFVFNKKQILYGYHLAKGAIREKDRVLLVEGYMDLIALHKVGVTNSVAIMGVALGDNSIERLKSLSKNFYLALDSDNAGMMAMERINALCMHHGLLPHFVDFSPQKDPDEFVATQGPLALTKRIDEAPIFLDHQLDRLIPDKIPEISDRKLELLHKAFAIIAPLQKELAAMERVVSFSKRIGLQSGSDEILGAYKDFLKRGAPKFTPKAEPVRQETSEEEAPLPTEMPFHEEGPTPIQETYVPLSKGERAFLIDLIRNPDCLTHGKMTELLDFVRHPEVEDLLARLVDLVYEIDDAEYPSVVGSLAHESNYSTEIKECIGAALFDYSPSKMDDKTLQKFLGDHEKRLKLDSLTSERMTLKERQKRCQNLDEMNQFLSQLRDVDKKINDLKQR